MPYVEVSAHINAAAAQIYPVIKAMEKYPEFMPDLESVKVLRREENATVTHWVSNVDGRVIQWTERDTFDDAKMCIHYEQIEGDLKKFQGDWLLLESDGGTVIKLTVDFEFGIPMIAGLLNPILKKKVRENSESMLQAIKKRMETLA